MRMRLIFLLPALLTGCLSIGPAPDSRGLAVDQQRWWERLSALCGGSFPGRLTERGSADERYSGSLRARFEQCRADTVDVAFDVAEERGRTWRFVRGLTGLRLHHLHADGAAGASGYGGATVGPGTPRQQDFVADSATARLLPGAAGNVWTVEIDRDSMLTYTLWRPGARERFRVQFTLPGAGRR